MIFRIGAGRAVTAAFAIILSACSPFAASGGAPEAQGQAPDPAPGGVSRVVRVFDREDAAGRIGAPAPDFSWVDPDGAVNRLSDLEGGVVIVNFWATWCVPCREEMPTFEALARDTPDVAFLMIDLQETPEAVRAFAEELSLTHLELIIDGEGSVARAYAPYSLPVTFYVTPAGRIAHIDIGGPLERERILRGIGKARRT